jgi:hypothetical protein
MAIAKKPSRNTSAIAEKFIAEAGAADAKEPAPEAAGERKPIMIRFDPVLLAKVDAAARRRGISRSAWIQYTVSRALDE